MADIFLAENELPVEVGLLDDVQVQYCEATEASLREILEQLTANATHSNDKEVGVCYHLADLLAKQ